MKKAILSILCLAIVFSGSLLAEKAKKKATVEVTFVLDTTGSMSGLIQGAKRKIWSIVNEIANGKPTPLIKVGLVAYRDKRDAYISNVYPLTDDLDKMYQVLMGFRAQGGGDFPEHVNQALYDAVHKIKWSEDKETLRIIFLVGDAPPHMDYHDDVKYPVTCEQAVRKDIVINTIRCGTSSSTEETWKDIASRSEGTYISIQQSGGMKTIATPYDREISTIGRKINKIYIPYGSSSARKMEARKLHMASRLAEDSAAEAEVSRYSYRAKMAKAGYSVTRKDLLSSYDKNPKVVQRINKSHLPSNLVKMKPEELKNYLKEKLEQRKKLRAKLLELSKKREAYIKEKNKKEKKKDSFDLKVIDMLEKEAAKKGIRYKK